MPFKTVNFTKSPERNRGSNNMTTPRTARDEEDAFYALKRIKKRAFRERAELAEKRKKAAITLPKLKFMED